MSPLVAYNDLQWGTSFTNERSGSGAVQGREAKTAILDFPATVAGDLEQRFREQSDKWERETQHLSSPTQIMMHPSYQAILGMGWKVVPFLLRDLQQNRRAWFGALSYLTRANPIKPKDAGKMDKMIEAWVQWGRDKGLL